MISVALYDDPEDDEPPAILIAASSPKTLITAAEARKVAAFLLERANVIEPLAVN